MAKKSPAANNNYYEIMKKQRKGIDIISQLPDELLIRILSLLPDADVTRSRILSNRWKHLWAFLPNLHLVIPQIEKQANKYINSVDQAIALRGGMPIQKLFLQSSYRLDDYRVMNWLREVEELEFRFLADDTYNVKFPWNLSINFSTLIKLTLEVVGLVTPKVEMPFPCLKKLNLGCTKYLNPNWLTNLLSRCPALEELCLDRLQLTCNSHMVMVSSPSIKRLTIKSSKLWDQELVIDAPKLEYLHFFYCYFRKCTLKSPTSLFEAHISTRQYEYQYVFKLLRYVSSTKMLTLSPESFLALYALGGMRSINLPLFPNLVKLEIPWVHNLFLILLNNMPNLEYLIFFHGLISFEKAWNPPKEDAPACLRFMLKEIFVVACVTPKEFAIVSYLLKHANNLEKLTIDIIDPKRRKPLLNIHRASKSCQVEFV